MTPSVDRIVHVASLGLWLFAVWHASEGWSGRRESPADRLKNLIAFVVVESFVLGMSHALYPAAIVAVAVVCVAIRLLSTRARSSRPIDVRDARDPSWMVPVTVSLVVGWAGLVRPLLDGDSLSYHLPNAASFVHAHSLWTTSTYYWWYPPASELFAASVFAIGGPATIGVAGYVAVALLGLRVAAFAREANFRPFDAAVIACAVVTVPAIGLQTASLQNDVWLTAMLLECAWVATHGRRDLTVWAIAALTKPVGAIFSIALALLAHRSRRELATTVAAAGVWALHDAIVSSGATVLASHQPFPMLIPTTIVGRGVHGFATLAMAIWHEGPGLLALGACCLLSPFFARSPVLRFAPLVFFVLFLCEPFGYATFAEPQLATGTSLRFALPALVFGVVAMLPLLSRYARTATLAAGLLAVWQVRVIVDIFWNDANTRGSLAAGLIVAVLTYAGGAHRRWVFPLALAAVGSYAALVNGAPARYYDARESVDGSRSSLFDWVERTKPAKIVARDFDAGMFSIVSPSSDVANAALRDDCLQAARATAVLIASKRSADASASARRCGTKLFEDATAIVVRPYRRSNARERRRE